MPSLPLLPEQPDHQLIACRQGEMISRARFLRDVLALAERLPAGRPLLNLCNDRYLFAVNLFAAICRGNLSLLPNSTTSETIAALYALEPGLLCVSDQSEPPFGLPHLRILFNQEAAAGTSPATPLIPATQRFACVFTSGSTGTPQPHFKTFGRLREVVLAEAQRLWTHTEGPCAVLGTVPFQHMYGLESTVLLPLFGGGVLSAERPYYPGDLADALATLPAPRFLVTTPFHLRNLLDAQIDVPPLAGLLSATAPLTRELAELAEAQLGVPVLEIYGTTETGQLATRQPTRAEAWELYSGVSLSQDANSTTASGGHLEQEIVLGDVLELIDTAHFHLLGRCADMINIAGKRSSLAFLNNVILRLPGVRDAAFCLPHEGETGRLAAFVVAPGISSRDILHGLRAWVDPVFLPRPIVFVSSLPRNATGKIPATAMVELIARHLGQEA